MRERLGKEKTQLKGSLVWRRSRRRRVGPGGEANRKCEKKIKTKRRLRRRSERRRRRKCSSDNNSSRRGGGGGWEIG